MIFNRQNCFKKIILKTEHIPTHQASCIQTVNDIKKKKKGNFNMQINIFTKGTTSRTNLISLRFNQRNPQYLY